jgi:hypothetical protein
MLDLLGCGRTGGLAIGTDAVKYQQVCEKMEGESSAVKKHGT